MHSDYSDRSLTLKFVTLPPKPWDRAGTSPFKPKSSGSTSDVVESSGTAKPGEIVPNTERNVLN